MNKYNIGEFKELFQKHLPEDHVIKTNILFDIFTRENWITLINIWVNSSSLLRYYNIKKELYKLAHLYNIKNFFDFDITLLGFQYYTDKIQLST
tara:strand:+ start:574 stop:855 length:282 start_codon:yes stop_codon:yes gene_type:complete